MYNDPTSTFPSSMDPQLRKLGLTTVLKRGVPSLDTEHIVCKVRCSAFSPEGTIRDADVFILIPSDLSILGQHLA